MSKPTPFAFFANRDRSYVTTEIFEELERYVDHGIPTSQFIRYVLLNDLYGAIHQASEVNGNILVWIGRFVVRYVPAEARMSEEKINAWRGTQTDVE